MGPLRGKDPGYGEPLVSTTRRAFPAVPDTTAAVIFRNIIPPREAKSIIYANGSLVLRGRKYLKKGLKIEGVAGHYTNRQT